MLHRGPGLRGLVQTAARSWWGRAGAVVTVIAVVLAIVLPAESSDAVRVVSIGPTVTKAQQLAPYDVWVPSNLDADWRATHASVNGLPGEHVEVHFDYVAPDGGYVGVVQENTARVGFIVRVTGVAHNLGVQHIGGRDWTRMGQGNNPQQISLVLDRTDGVVVIVSGTTTWPLLTQLAAALRPTSG